MLITKQEITNKMAGSGGGSVEIPLKDTDEVNYRVILRIDIYERMCPLLSIFLVVW